MSMSRWFSFLIFSLFFSCSGLKGQGSLLITAGTEVNTPDFFASYHRYAFGVEVQKVLDHRLYWGTGLRVKTDRIGFLPKIEKPDPPFLWDFHGDVIETAFGTPGLSSSFSSISVVQGELPMYLAFRLGKVREVPCLIQLGAQHRLAKVFVESNFPLISEEAIVYSIVVNLSLQFPIVERDEFGISFMPYYGLGQHFDTLTTPMEIVDWNRIRHCYGLSIQTHLYGWR